MNEDFTRFWTKNPLLDWTLEIDSQNPELHFKTFKKLNTKMLKSEEYLLRDDCHERFRHISWHCQNWPLVPPSLGQMWHFLNMTKCFWWDPLPPPINMTHPQENTSMKRQLKVRTKPTGKPYLFYSPGKQLLTLAWVCCSTINSQIWDWIPGCSRDAI